MKYMTYVLRNARRNPVRSLLTVASTGVTFFLMTILVAFFALNDDLSESSREYNRIFTLNAQGFAGYLPIAVCNTLKTTDGVIAVSPMSWYGGKYGEETIPFAQFGVDTESILTIYDDLIVPPDQVKAFQEDKAGCLVGRKLAEDRGLKIGDPLPLKAGAYPFDLPLTIRAIYVGATSKHDPRMCFFHWEMLDEGLKRAASARTGNAAMIVARCKNADVIPSVCKRVDDSYQNSDTPTRTQSEEAFGKMFAEMLGDLSLAMRLIAFAVIFALIFVAGNAMSMALRERTTEIAVLKAIGFGKQLILGLVLAEAMVLCGIGGGLGAIGCKVLCDVVDVARYSGGFLPLFYVSWPTALTGVAVSLLIGFLSGIIPAFLSSRLSVVNGLRKVV